MNRIFKSAFTVASIGTLTRLVAFGYKIFLSRAMGASNLGSYQIALSVFFTLTTISSSGIPLVLSRKIAVEGDPKERNKLVTSAVVLGEVIAFTLCVSLALFPGIRGLIVKGTSAEILLMLLPASLSSTLYAVIRARFWGLGRFSAYSVTETLEGLLRMALGIALVSTNAFGETFVGATVAFVVSDFVSAVVLFVLYLIDGGGFSAPKRIIPIARGAIPMTSVRFFAELITSLTAVILPRVMISAGTSASEALADFGRMSGMALPVLMAPTTIIGALSVVLVPEIAGDNARRDLRAVKRKLSTALSFAALTSCVAISVFLPLGKGIARLLFADEKAGQLISLSCPAMLVMNVGAVSSSCMNSLGLEGKTMRNYLLGASLTVLSVLTLPRYVGIYAMPIGLGLSHTLTCALNLCVLKKNIGLSSAPLKATGLGILCAVSASSVAWTGLRILPFTSLVNVLITGLTAVAVCLVLMSLLGASETKYLLMAIKKRPKNRGAR